MPIIKLSQDFITNDLHCPEGKNRIEYCDSEVPGLYIEVRATSQGTGTAYLRYRDAKGITRHQKLTCVANSNLVDLRKLARTAKSEINLGADPCGDKRARKEQITVATAFEEHYLPFAKPRKRSYARDAEMYFLRIKPEFGHLRLSDVSKKQVQTFHASLLEVGLKPATADLYLKLIRRAYNVFEEFKLLELSPLKKLHLFNPDNRIEHFLSDAELARLTAVLRTDSNRPVCQIAMFLLGTGARLNEVLQATWEQIDRENRTWKVPALRSKSKKIRSIPLGDSPMAILDEIYAERTTGPIWLSSSTGRQFTTIMKVWTRLRNKAGLPRLRLHDLRHSFASLLVNSGRTLYEVQQILGHSDSKVTERYAHISTRTLQDAANAASLKINSAIQAGSEQATS